MKKIPALDGFRALAILIVLVSHCRLGEYVPGMFGVAVFFLLSGFLITTLLRQEQVKTGDISFKNFYIRRFIRLMPVLFVVTFLVSLLPYLGFERQAWKTESLISVLFYYGNYYTLISEIQEVRSYIPYGLGTVWSLAVEEHFYLVYPPLMYWLIKTKPKPERWLLALCIFFTFWRLFLYFNFNLPELYFLKATDTRFDAILWGCWLAFAYNPYLDPPQPAQQTRHFCWAVAGAGLLLLSFLYREDWFRSTLRLTLQSLALLPIFYFAIGHSKNLWTQWLGSHFMSYIGILSYGIYLTHLVICSMIEDLYPNIPWYFLLPSTFILSILVAEGLSKWVEQPSAKLRQYFG
jgi:peptidoglycan/LPS O-acetylase OafA/YrhL